MLYEDLFFVILELAMAAGLYILADYAVKAPSTKWKLCYVVPIVVMLGAIVMADFEISLLGAYLGAGLLLIGFVKEEARLRKRLSLIAGVCMLFSALLCNINPGYRTVNYVAEFKRGFAEMKQHYVMTEHKEIDWDSLYKEYLPRFQEAYRNHDEVANYLAWNAFALEFQDGHVTYYSAADEALNQKALQQLWGNDYGLSLMTLHNGQTVAVNVEADSEAAKAGIHNGTIITAWNGKAMEAAIREASETEAKVLNFAAKENEAFYSALAVAGMGGDSAVISYLDETGQEQRISLQKIGTYYERMKDTLEAIDKGVEISNLAWQNIDEDTALMRMRFMSYDAKANYEQMEQEIRTKLLELKAAGVSNLIFDMRSNGGGSGSYVKHIVKLIAPEGEHIYAYDGVLNLETLQYEKGNKANTYRVGECETYQGEDIWGHGQVILLVNAQTVSAGDHFTKLAADFPNVTVMGFTHTNCSAQGVNQVSLAEGSLSYSAALLLNADGTVFIDTDSRRETTVPLDVKIPLDEEAVRVLFDEGEDYVLQCAMEYLK
ncbi:MAG: peptidase S41 [Lachnospiraceae bacterium]|nr:peptidase S41 [Lachnospiraceae bacterium]